MKLFVQIDIMFINILIIVLYYTRPCGQESVYTVGCHCESFVPHCDAPSNFVHFLHQQKKSLEGYRKTFIIESDGKRGLLDKDRWNGEGRKDGASHGHGVSSSPRAYIIHTHTQIAFTVQSPSHFNLHDWNCLPLFAVTRRVASAATVITEQRARP